MKTLKNFVLFIFVTLSYSSVSFAGDMRTIVSLNGKWSFSVGDDMKWAEAGFNDKNWDLIQVPNAWEKEGYVGYDGYAWYRKKFRFPQFENDRTVYLYTRNIDDVDEVYFNGKKIGSTGSFPADYTTAYNWERKYIIPKELIKAEGENAIAIRVYDEGGDGGLVSEGVRICYDEDEEFLDLNLAGNWKFKLFDNKEWKYPEFDDSRWKEILVPMSWESQGNFSYDGNAWYRKSFTIPANMADKKLYLSLGKVDDFDKVYFNGELIGEVSPSKEKSEFKRHRNGEYSTRRAYEIPKKLIKTGINVIAVKVYDMGGAGGIYEGPVGIMTERGFKAYADKPDRSNDNYDFNYDFFDFGDFMSDLFEGIFNND